MAADAYAVMREGMRGKVGIGKVALFGREYLVAIKPQQHGLVMYTLHHAAEIRTIDQIEELSTVPRTVKPQELKLAKQVVEMFEGELNLKDYKDEYKEELRKIIDARVAGEEYVAAEVEAAPSNVVDLMAALRKSLDAASASKKPAKPAELAAKTTGSRRRSRRGSERKTGSCGCLLADLKIGPTEESKDRTYRRSDRLCTRMIDPAGDDRRVCR